MKTMKHFAAALWIVAIAACAVSGHARVAGSRVPDGKGPWVFSYFANGTQNGLHLAYSLDGLNWKPVAGGKILDDPRVGSQKLFRDPCIAHGPDGVYHLVWTTGWTGGDIGHATSTDLIHWSDPQVIPVMAKEPTTRNAWAPEVIWDPENKNFLIYWSSTIPGRFAKTDGQDANAKNNNPGYNHRIYATTTADFKLFTPTRLFYDPGFNVIDATIQPTGDAKAGQWIMVLKNETNKPFTPQKNLHVAFADHAAGPYGKPGPNISGKDWAEGPTLFKAGDKWIVMFDQYRRHRYGALESADLVNWTDVTDKLACPPDLRHGTALPVAKKALDALLALKSDAPQEPTSTPGAQ
jgi:beta-xylosidase